MKKITKYIVFLTFLFLSLAIKAQIFYDVSIKSSDLKYEMRQAKDGLMYQTLTLENIGNNEKVGAPNLPVKFVKLIIPTQQDVDKVNFTYIVEKKRTLSNKIYPTQPDIPTSINFIEPEFVKADPDIYESEKPYPRNVVELVNSGYLDNNNHIVTLKIIPFQYFPKLDELEELNNIKINLSLTSNNHEIVLPKTRTFKTQEIWDKALNFIVDNKNDISKYQQKPNLTEKFELSKNQLKKPILPCEFYEYTIITNYNLQGYFNEFVNYKNSKGLYTGVVTLESIYNEYDGDIRSNLYDAAGKVRAYLNDLWELGGTWVLLGGDFSVVPIRYGCGWDLETWTRWTTDDYKIPADIYFADRNGNWNVDGDQWTGQPNDDNPDYYPEFFLGRLLCTTGEEINDWTDKVILYEQDPGNGDPDYVIECFMIESDQLQAGNQAETVRDHLPSFNTTIWREQPAAYDANPTFPTAHQVLIEMNNRYGFYGWFGHGSPTTVTTMSRRYNEQPRRCLDVEDAVEVPTAQVIENQDALDNLTNVDYPAIIYSIGCDHTPFDNYHTDPDDYNMGESFTVNNLTGGPAFLGNTRYGWISASYHLFEQFADLIESGNRHLGVAELLSKHSHTGGYYHYLNYSHNLVGCPETKIYTSIEVEKRSADPRNIEHLSNNEIPMDYKIIGSYPNPFNPSTRIKYALPYSSDVEIKIYDIMGCEVWTTKEFGQTIGYHEIMWDGNNNNGVSVASGIYIYTLKALSLEKEFEEFSGSSKLILLK